MRLRKHEIIICRYCGNPFKRALKPLRGRSTNRGLRRMYAITCSHKCSRMYNNHWDKNKLPIVLNSN